jgi:hypothetical protein
MFWTNWIRKLSTKQRIRGPATEEIPGGFAKMRPREAKNIATRARIIISI